jgi:hypothetical protein
LHGGLFCGIRATVPPDHLLPQFDRSSAGR